MTKLRTKYDVVSRGGGAEQRSDDGGTTLIWWEMWHGSTWEWDGPSANHNTIEQNRARKTTCKSTNSRQWAGMDGVGDGEWGGEIGRAHV